MVDLTTLSDDQLDRLRQQVAAEIARRRTIQTATELADKLAADYAHAVGRKDGDEWVQPTGAHDAYPEGARVTHNGKLWVSLTPANVWEPGVSQWAEESGLIGGVTQTEWVQPTGAHDAYQKGDRVMYEGVVYTSLIDNNVWSPVEYPQGWKKLS